MNSFLEPAALPKMNFYRDIFQGFCLKVSEDFCYRRPPHLFVAIVKKVVDGLFKIIQNYVINKINN